MTIPARIKQVVVVTLAVSWAAVAPAADFTATVVKVRDGDSLVVLRNNRQIEVRLEGIDCPELHQAFGQKAKQATFSLVGGKTVTVQPTGIDQYNRTLANVILPDGRNLNQELVRQGYAWWFRKYSKDQNLAKLEAEARQKKLGLWADPNPTPPWDWRKAAEEKPAVGEVVLNGVSIIGLLPDPKGRDEGQEAVEIGNNTEKPVDLAGWKLQDRAGNEYRLCLATRPSILPFPLLRCFVFGGVNDGRD